MEAPGAGTVAAELCAAPIVARAALGQVLENADLENHAELASFVASRSNASLTTYLDFGVEIAIMSSGGNVGK
eukprot:2003965-Pyramimonas_sp.AAC.1